MDNYGDMAGSDELSIEEFEAAEKQHEEILAEFYKVVQESDEAKTFLNTAFGIRLRKTLVAEKLRATKMCAESIGTDKAPAAKYAYDVVIGVEKIFGWIIKDGNTALEQLKMATRKGD